MLIADMNLRDISLFLYFKLLLCRTRLIRSDQSVFYVSKINLQFPIINHNRDNIIKSSRVYSPCFLSEEAV